MTKIIKHQALNFIRDNEPITFKHLRNQFKLTESGARSYLHFLMNQGLVKRDLLGRYYLTHQGEKRLNWFNENGCTSKNCYKCQNLASKNIIKCSHCKRLFNKDDLCIEPEEDFIFFKNEAGVYCPACDKLIISPEKAEKLGIEWRN